MGATARAPVPRHQRDEEAQQQLARMRKIVAMGIRSLRSGRDWEAWLNRAEPLIPVGFANTMLIWAQRPQAIMLHSYDAWQQKGRQVNRGERGIWIIADPKQPTEPEGNGAGVRPAVVFDLSQTHGTSVPVRTITRAEQPPDGAWEVLASLALREGFRVARGDCAEGDAFITWRDRRVHIRRDADDATAVTALAHQLGHVLLHANSPYLEGIHTLECSGVRKVEADSVALLIATRLGLAAPAVLFPSVPSWAGTDERAHPVQIIESVGERILRASAKAFACLDSVLPAPTLAGDQELEMRATRTTEPSASMKTRENRDPVPRARPKIIEPTPVTAGDDQLSTAVRLQLAAQRFYTGRLRGSWAAVYLESRG